VRGCAVLGLGWDVDVDGDGAAGRRCSSQCAVTPALPTAGLWAATTPPLFPHHTTTTTNTNTTLPCPCPPDADLEQLGAVTWDDLLDTERDTSNTLMFSGGVEFAVGGGDGLAARRALPQGTTRKWVAGRGAAWRRLAPPGAACAAHGRGRTPRRPHNSPCPPSPPNPGSP
jgi:hypothetical protein